MAGDGEVAQRVVVGALALAPAEAEALGGQPAVEPVGARGPLAAQRPCSSTVEAEGRVGAVELERGQAERGEVRGVVDLDDRPRRRVHELDGQQQVLARGVQDRDVALQPRVDRRRAARARRSPARRWPGRGGPWPRARGRRGPARTASRTTRSRARSRPAPPPPRRPIARRAPPITRRARSACAGASRRSPSRVTSTSSSKKATRPVDRRGLGQRVLVGPGEALAGVERPVGRVALVGAGRALVAGATLGHDVLARQVEARRQATSRRAARRACCSASSAPSSSMRTWRELRRMSMRW